MVAHEVNSQIGITVQYVLIDWNSQFEFVLDSAKPTVRYILSYDACIMITGRVSSTKPRILDAVSLQFNMLEFYMTDLNLQNYLTAAPSAPYFKFQILCLSYFNSAVGTAWARNFKGGNVGNAT